MDFRPFSNLFFRLHSIYFLVSSCQPNQVPPPTRVTLHTVRVYVCYCGWGFSFYSKCPLGTTRKKSMEYCGIGWNKRAFFSTGPRGRCSWFLEEAVHTVRSGRLHSTGNSTGNSTRVVDGRNSVTVMFYVWTIFCSTSKLFFCSCCSLWPLQKRESQRCWLRDLCFFWAAGYGA